MMKNVIILLFIFMGMIHASVLPENVLTRNCLQSYLNTYKSQKNHKAFVYARESETGKDRCGWGYGYESAEEAQKGAMKQCTGYQLNAECIIIDVDGEYLVKEGDFTLITQPDETPLSKEVKEKLLKEAKVLIRGNCLPFFKDYLNDIGHKAFAYSLDTDGKYACGKIYNNSTQIAAKIGAIKGCNNNKNKRAKKKPKSPCKLYAIGNKILLKAKDFGIDELPQIEKILGNDEYHTKLNKAKTLIRKGPCLFQMKYYLRGSEYQAYFLAQDQEGKQVCGRSEGELNENEALTKALRQCEERVSEENLIAVCKIVAKNFDIVGIAEDFVIKKEKNEPHKSSEEQQLVTSKEEVIKKVNTKKSKYFQPSIKAKDLRIKNAIDMHKSLPLKETLKITADTLNKTLPIMVDEELRFDKVSAEGSKMTFHYMLVHFTLETMTAKQLKSLMYEDMKTQVCTDKDTKILLKKGMVVDYTYNGKDKTHITTFAFDAKACGFLTNVEQIKNNILNMIKKKEK